MFAFLANAETWRPYTDSAQVLSGYATAVAAIVAVISAFLVLLQIWASRRAAQQIHALETHRDYIKLCVEKPDLCCSNTMLAYIGKSSFSGVAGWPTTAKVEECLWFLSYMLHTMEQLAETTSSIFGQPDKAWRALICSQISYHEPLVREVWPDSRKHYSAKLRKIIDDCL